jgi:hypothetical protein
MYITFVYFSPPRTRDVVLVLYSFTSNAWGFGSMPTFVFLSKPHTVLVYHSMHASPESIIFLSTCSTFVFFSKVATYPFSSGLFYLPLGTSHFCFLFVASNKVYEPYFHFLQPVPISIDHKSEKIQELIRGAYYPGPL